MGVMGDMGGGTGDEGRESMFVEMVSAGAMFSAQCAGASGEKLGRPEKGGGKRFCLADRWGGESLDALMRKPWYARLTGWFGVWFKFET